MANDITTRDLSPLHAAARQWIDSCLIGDQSLLIPERTIWTSANANEMQRCFVERPDSSSDDFFVKLERQLADAPPTAEQLAADLPLLAESVLAGVGSAGTAYATGRWRELAYLIALVRSLKAMPREARCAVLNDYDRFLDWIDKVPTDGDRQFRHMLRYFAFPDRVERMCSNRDRRSVLEGFGVASQAETRLWSDRQLDDAMLSLRQREQAKRPGTILDFYEGAMPERWRKRRIGARYSSMRMVRGVFALRAPKRTSPSIT